MPTTITTEADVLALIEQASATLEAGDDSDFEALVRHLAPALLARPTHLRLAFRAAWPTDADLIRDAAQDYADETAAARRAELEDR